MFVLTGLKKDYIMMRTAYLGLLLVVSCGILSGCSTRSDHYNIGSDSRSFEEMSDDAKVTYSINRKYLKDDLIHTVHIDVDTHRGVVTLHGMVDHQEEATRAIDIALDTENVTEVISNLVLRNQALSPRGVVYKKKP
jgi:osmotically-inducible protein OsmY